MSINGVLLEKCMALRDTWQHVELYGTPVKLYIREEDNINRGSYNSLKKKSTATGVTYNFKAFPVNFSPTDKQKEKAGIREHVSVIIYIPFKYFNDNGLKFDDIDTIRSTVELMGHTYNIKDKNRVTPIYDEFIYISLGLYQV